MSSSKRSGTNVAAWATRSFWGRTIGVAAGLALALAGTATAACRLQQFDLPVQMVNKRPITTLTINGTELKMLLDSGAFFSVLSEATAAQLKLPLRPLPSDMRITGFAGNIKSRVTTADKVSINGAELPPLDFLVGGNELGLGIQGILGRNILAMADADYDLAHGVVHITFPRGDCEKTMLAHWAGDAPVIEAPIERRPRSNDLPIQVEVQVNGRTLTALLDTGAPSSVMTLWAAHRAGIEDSTMTPHGRSSGAGTGFAQSWRGPLRELKLGGEVLRDNQIEIADTRYADVDMILGLEYFLSHRIYASRLQKRLYATWNGRPVFEEGPADAARYDPRYAATPAAVDETSADALARRGTAALAAGDLDRAQADLDQACALAPERADLRWALARVLVARKDARGALTELDAALAIDPALHEARLQRAQLRDQLKDADGALDDLRTLDAQLPANAHQRAAMGRLHAGRDRLNDATRQFDLWVTHHPHDNGLAAVLDQRCWVRVRLGGDLQLAAADCDKAADLDEQNAGHQEHLGWVLLRLDRARQARNAFEAALKIKPQQAGPLYGRGLALQRLKGDAAGREDIEAALRLDPQIASRMTRSGALPAPATQSGDQGAANPA